MKVDLQVRPLLWADIKESRYLKLKNDPLVLRPGYVPNPSNPPAIERALKYEDEEDEWNVKRLISLNNIEQIQTAHTGGRTIYRFEHPFVVIRRHLTPISEFEDSDPNWDKNYHKKHPRYYRLDRHGSQPIKEFLLVDHWIETYLVDAWYDKENETAATGYASWVIDNSGHEIYVRVSDILLVSN